MSEFPELGGTIGMFRDGIISLSRSNQKDMALGGALAIAGALTANRFSLDGHPVNTTMYVLNVASTGSGKGAAISFCNKLFGRFGLQSRPTYNLLGISNYSSDAAIIKRLVEQRTRLDIIDEFGQVFKGLSMKGDRKSSIGECLKILFSCDGEFKGHYTKTDGFVGGCISPSISILGSIQPATLISHAGGESIFDGFMGRFIYFMEDLNAEWLGNQLNGGLDHGVLDYISKACFEAYPENPLIDKDMVGNTILDTGSQDFTRQQLFVDKSASGIIRELDELHYNDGKKKKLNGEYQEAAVYARSIEITSKLAKMICVSSGRRTITAQDFFLAKKVVDVSNEKSKSVLMSAGAPKEKTIARDLLKKVQTASDGTIKRSEAMRSLHLTSKEMSDAVSYLCAMGQIEETFVDTGAKNGKKVSFLCLPMD